MPAVTSFCDLNHGIEEARGCPTLLGKISLMPGCNFFVISITQLIRNPEHPGFVRVINNLQIT